MRIRKSEILRTRVVLQQQILYQVAKYLRNILLTRFHVLVNELQPFFDLSSDNVGLLFKPLLLFIFGLLRPEYDGIDIKGQMDIVEVGEHFFVDEEMVEKFYRFDSKVVLLVFHST